MFKELYSTLPERMAGSPVYVEELNIRGGYCLLGRIIKGCEVFIGFGGVKRGHKNMNMWYCPLGNDSSAIAWSVSHVNVIMCYEVGVLMCNVRFGQERTGNYITR